MAASEQQQLLHAVVEMVDSSETEGSDHSDDSQDDPTYDIFEETRSKFSSLSVGKKSKSRIQREMGLDFAVDMDYVEIVAPELDKKDQKSFEMVQKMIEDGQLDKLKVDQCKVYLRKNGLRLTGNKDTLIQRIKEHIDISNGGGERKYPASSFVLNCKGDACTGDVVMFEQNVYEMFNIASRSASAPSCGTRTIAGRIVKEGYGAAKQQHTFTIEVLWSKGEKPLPPLHPLLIKGRNLYRLKTLRQRWENEGDRQRVLMEKHSRGSLARADREVRMKEKEMRKKNRHLKDAKKTTGPKTNDSQLYPLNSGLSVDSRKLVQENCNQGQQHPPLPRQSVYPSICKENIGVPQNMLKYPGEIQYSKHEHPRSVSSHGRDESFADNYSHKEPQNILPKYPGETQQSKHEPSADNYSHRNPQNMLNYPAETQQRKHEHPRPVSSLRRDESSADNYSHRNPQNMLKYPGETQHSKHEHPRPVSSQRRDEPFADNDNHRNPQNMLKYPGETQHRKHEYSFYHRPSRGDKESFAHNHSHREPLRSIDHFPPRSPSRGGYHPPRARSPSWDHRPPLASRSSWDHCPPLWSSWGGHNHEQQVCRYYARGRCNYGRNCKFLHD